MNMHGARTLSFAKWLVASLALLLFAFPALCGDKKTVSNSGSGGGSHGASSGGGGSHAASTGSGGGGGSHANGNSSGASSSGSHSGASSGGGSSYGSHTGATTSGGSSYGSHTGTPSGGTTYGSHTGTPSGGTTYGSHTGTPSGGTTYGNHSGTPSGGSSYGSHDVHSGHDNSVGGGGSHNSGGSTFGGHDVHSGHDNNAGGGGQHFGNSGPAGHDHNYGAGPGYGHGMTAPRGHVEVETRNGAMMRRPDGRIATFHDNRRGMDVHHGLGGSRVVIVERGDHSRIFAGRGGYGYVQRPYRYNGHEYAQRSYYSNGHYYHSFYGRYYFHGVYVNPYFPRAYYRPAFYGWAYSPWARPISFGWGWGGSPWYGYYGSYFTPYPVYSSPSLWLTDYLIANSLQAAYQARADAHAEALYNPAPLTPDVKQLIADEVREQISLENTEAQASGSNAEPDAASSSIQRLLTDGRPHVFVAGADLDVTDAGGNECALSQGDALQLRGQVAPDAQAANLAVLASKGGRECPKGDVVAVALGDLQDMQNHMRETIDAGLQEMQSKQGQGGLPAAPSGALAAPTPSPMAALAPPPPPESEVAAEINQQSQAADQAEKEAASGPGPNAGAPAAEPVSINVGQTIDQVTAALGTPAKVVNLGAKKIYVYKDMKVTFLNGRVTDVQ
jgi:hypothetical protein